MSWFLAHPILYSLLIVLVALGPLVASATICVPKWYRVKIRPHIEESALLDRINSVLSYDLGGPEPGKVLLIFLALFCLPALIILFTAWWVGVAVAYWLRLWRVVITRACPYVNPQDKLRSEWPSPRAAVLKGWRLFRNGFGSTTHN